MKKLLSVILGLMLALGLMVGCDDAKLPASPTITEIVVSTPATKTAFEYGEEFNYDGLVVSKVLSNDTKLVLDTTEYTVICPNYSATTPGSYTVNICLKDDATKTTSYNVTVAVPSVSELNVTPGKTSFTWGEEFSSDGIVVEKILQDESAVVCKPEEIIIDSSAFNKNNKGTYTIIVKVGEKSVTYDVTVAAPLFSSVAIKTPATKLNFAWGEDFNADGIIIEKVFEDGAKLDCEASEVTIDSSAYKKDAKGTYTIIVKVGEKSVSYDVTVAAPKLTSLAVTPAKTIYENGSWFSTSGMTVETVDESGAKNALEYKEYKVDSSSYDRYTAGTYTITVTYKADPSISTTFEVTVKEDYLVGIKISSKPKIKYHVGDAFTTEGLVVKTQMKSGKGVELKDTEYTLDSSAFNGDTSGKYTIKISAVISDTTYEASYDTQVVALKGNMVVTVEALTIGGGYIVPPTIVPFYETDNQAEVLLRALQMNGFGLDHGGCATSGFYLQAIYDGYTTENVKVPYTGENPGVMNFDNSQPTIPYDLLTEVYNPEDKADMTYADLVEEGNSYGEGRKVGDKVYASGLGEFSYNFMSGWMFTVNHEMPDVGAADVDAVINDVARWQFSLYGFGADLGFGWGMSYLESADKSDLLRTIAQINADKTQTEFGAAYNDAMAVLQNMLSSQQAIDDALARINAMMKIDRVVNVLESHGDQDIYGVAYDTAKAVSENPDATTNDIIKALEFISTQKSLIDSVASIESDKTEASYGKAFTDAKDLLVAGTGSLEEVQGAINYLTSRSLLNKKIADIEGANKQEIYGEYYTNIKAVYDNANADNDTILDILKSTPEGFVTMSVEALSLGGGYIIEPCLVPFFNGDSHATLIVRTLNEKGFGVDYSGTIEKSFYIKAIYDGYTTEGVKAAYEGDKPGVINVIKDKPAIPYNMLLNVYNPYDKADKSYAELTGAGNTYGEGRKVGDIVYASGLGEFAYNNMTNWTYTVNNEMAPVGASDFIAQDGNVVRWQYSLNGYGADIGFGWGVEWCKSEDKSELLTKIATINALDNIDAYGDAYVNAMTVAQNMLASSKDIKTAIDGFLPKDNLINKIDAIDAKGNSLDYANAYTQAVEVLNNGKATVAQTQEAIDALNNTEAVIAKLAKIQADGREAVYGEYYTNAKKVIDDKLFGIEEINTIYASLPLGFVTIDVEALSVGGGFIVEPIIVPFFSGDTHADILVNTLHNNGFGLNHGGTTKKMFYMQVIYDGTTTEGVKYPYVGDNPGVLNILKENPEVPQNLLDLIVAQGTTYEELVGAGNNYGTGRVDGEKTYANGIGEFTYNNMTGWMFTVDNEMANLGASDYKLEDGQTIRWQFSLHGFGSDLGFGWGDTLYESPDKSALLTAIATAKLNKQEVSLGEVYTKALQVAGQLVVTQKEVDACVNAFNS